MSAALNRTHGRMVLLYAVRLSLASPHGSWYDKMIIIVEINA